MKVDEVSLRLNKFINKLLGMYFPLDSIPNKMMNATARYWIQQNWYRVKPIINQFADQNDEIDVDELVRCYEATMFEDDELRINMQKLIPSQYEWIKSMLPNKVVILHKQDLYDMLGKTSNNLQKAIQPTESIRFDVV